MKAFLLPITLLFLTLSSGFATDADKRMANIVFEQWSKASIRSFELTDASFEQGYDRLLREWADQNIGAPFPLVLSDFEIDPSVKGEPPRVTMALKTVPFSDALELLCKATGRRVLPRSGPLRMQFSSSAGPSGDWYTRVYQLSPALLKKLTLDPANKIRIPWVYQNYGIRFESWMAANLIGDRLYVLAGEEQHQQIILINRLLESGYTITPPGSP